MHFANPLLQKFSAHFERTEVPAKTMLLREGEVSKKMFFIETGCLRAWFNNDGKDVTTQFFFENETVGSIESFIKGQPGLLNIESIEPSVIHALSKKDFSVVLQQWPELNLQVQDLLFQRLFFYQKLFLSRIKDSPEKRYAALLKDQPGIIQRVPQHYIASYLGITPVSLSRIRNRK